MNKETLYRVTYPLGTVIECAQFELTYPDGCHCFFDTDKGDYVCVPNDATIEEIEDFFNERI